MLIFSKHYFLICCTSVLTPCPWLKSNGLELIINIASRAERQLRHYSINWLYRKHLGDLICMQEETGAPGKNLRLHYRESRPFLSHKALAETLHTERKTCVLTQSLYPGADFHSSSYNCIVLQNILHYEHFDIKHFQINSQMSDIYLSIFSASVTTFMEPSSYLCRIDKLISVSIRCFY